MPQAERCNLGEALIVKAKEQRIFLGIMPVFTEEERLERKRQRWRIKEERKRKEAKLNDH